MLAVLSTRVSAPGVSPCWSACVCRRRVGDAVLSTSVRVRVRVRVRVSVRVRVRV